MAEQAKPDLASRAHAFLFSEGGSLTKKKLASLLECGKKELDEAIAVLGKRLEGGGVTLLETETEAALAIAQNVSKEVRDALQNELGEEIGEAGLEVLATILYCGPSTRAEIDYIRGVNTAWTLRSLLSRALLERAGNPEDAREYLYRPTIELLAHLGVKNGKELPDYATIAHELASFEAQREPFENNASTHTATDTDRNGS